MWSVCMAKGLTCGFFFVYVIYVFILFLPELNWKENMKEKKYRFCVHTFMFLCVLSSFFFDTAFDNDVEHLSLHVGRVSYAVLLH